MLISLGIKIFRIREKRYKNKIKEVEEKSYNFMLKLEILLTLFFSLKKTQWKGVFLKPILWSLNTTSFIKKTEILGKILCPVLEQDCKGVD